MKILSAKQIRSLDQYTIEHEPIRSIDLMERAADACYQWIVESFGGDPEYVILAGPGNNGGDGLAIARMLALTAQNVRVFVDSSGSLSPDCATNLERLKQLSAVAVHDYSELPSAIGRGAVVIDAMFGTGLSRPLEDPWATRAAICNSLDNVVIAVDLPSGVYADSPTTGPAVQADFTLSFQVPKLAFFIPENEDLIGEWTVLDIGLSREFLDQLDTPWSTIEMQMVADNIKARKKFDHKGTNGHALLIAGSFGKVGAATLAARAVLRSGAGLLTVHAPRKATDILQVTIPEAMASADCHEYIFSGIDRIPDKVTAIGIGCGLGQHDCTTLGMKKLFEAYHAPVVVDADGLNTLGANPELMDLLPRRSILTPHMKEFERIFTQTDNHFERLELLRKRTAELELICVLKGAHTAVALPDGTVHFNTTGNPGMATAGSGDVLTGIITGLLAQGYSPENAAIIGVFLHGLAGDIAHVDHSDEALIASDIIDNLGRAFKRIHRS